jgi:phosphoribosylglycinamide formyltransferase 1
MSKPKQKLAILLSGRGSNFVAIHEAIERGELDAEIAAVVSNKVDAAGLKRAEDEGLPVFAIPHNEYPTRGEHEAAVLAVLERQQPDWIVLAGYMRLLSPSFIERYRGRILNIHPSLLPAFPGVNSQAQAHAHGVRVTGCTVHFVDETLDGGPILEQRVVIVYDNDTVESLTARILVQEHEAYVDALRLVLSGAYVVDGRRVVRVEEN